MNMPARKLFVETIAFWRVFVLVGCVVTMILGVRGVDGGRLRASLWRGGSPDLVSFRYGATGTHRDRRDCYTTAFTWLGFVARDCRGLHHAGFWPHRAIDIHDLQSGREVTYVSSFHAGAAAPLIRLTMRWSERLAASGPHFS